MNNKSRWRVGILGAALGLALMGTGCLYPQHKKKAQPDLNASAQPDKILYDRATEDFKHGRYTVARLNLQTLINTYPDSEYLAKAKLAIADSYYKEGGTDGLLQAIAEYKDFITFFPFLDEASYAQMQVAMAHYRLMEKADRDHTEGLAAEQEFQTFLLKYPKSPQVQVAEQRLREVQENLAQGDFLTAQYYYIKGSYRASAARLIELTSRYPLFSDADRANWMLGNIYARNEKKDVADKYYARIVQDYPLSRFAGAAKNKLVADGAPVPQVDPDAVKRMKEEAALYAKNRPNVLRRTTGILHSGPDLSTAAHEGEPNLQPEGDVVSATDVLRRGAPEPTLATASTTASPESPEGGASDVDSNAASGVGVGGSAGGGLSVETVPSDSSTPQPVESGSAPITGEGNPTLGVSASGTSAQPDNAPAAPTGGPVVPGATAVPGEQVAPGSGAPVPAADAKISQAAGGSTTAPSAQSGNSSSTSSSQAKSGKKADALDTSTESTSKKKKGWHKLVPW
jgi:outer membrane protein assembly factor BamD